MVSADRAATGTSGTTEGDHVIVIQGTIVTKADRRDDVVAACNAMRAATIDEQGCLAYRFGFATDDPTVLVVTEQWADEEALGAHMGTEHMATFGAVIGDVVGGPVDVTRFEIASHGPLFG